MGIACRVLVPAIGIHSVGGALLAALLIQFLYFFLQEMSTGQTIGKRSARIKVIGIDAAAPTPRQLAIRNALRIFDALPLFYASGLVSVMWTGPGRRQRMGDRVAHTSVILQPGGKAMSTPGWMLPTLTIASVLLSVVIYGVLYDKYRAPSVDANAMIAPIVPGFSGDNSQPPVAGQFTAQAELNGHPAVDLTTGKAVVRSWHITNHCRGTACERWLTRSSPSIGEERGQLIPAADGWHVTFPTHSFKMRCPDNGKIVTVLERGALALQFVASGHQAVAHEVDDMHSLGCGDRRQANDWSASVVDLGASTFGG